MNDLISIIVPVYNVEKYLDECICSLVNQTYTNLEIILVDDGSPDNCPAMCDAWAEKDSRIRVIHKENGGQADARNAGLEIARGEYLCFVDSDDYVLEEMCASMIELLKTHCVDVVSSSFIVYKDGKKVFSNNFQSRYLTAKETMAEALVGGCIEPAVCGKLFSRVCFEDVRFPVNEIYEDYAVLPTIFSKCKYVYYYEKQFYVYRYNFTGTTKSAYSEKSSDRLIRDRQISRDVLAVWPDLKQEVQYSLGMGAYSSLLLLAKDKNKIKIYRSDYDYYLKNLRDHLGLLLTYRTMSVLDKLKLLLVAFELYGPLWRKLHKS